MQELGVIETWREISNKSPRPAVTGPCPAAAPGGEAVKREAGSKANTAVEKCLPKGQAAAEPV